VTHCLVVQFAIGVNVKVRRTGSPDSKAPEAIIPTDRNKYPNSFATKTVMGISRVRIDQLCLS
jgi:hypothetical protein